LNLRPSGYEPDELPGCSTPHQLWAIIPIRRDISSHFFNTFVFDLLKFPRLGLLEFPRLGLLEFPRLGLLKFPRLGLLKFPRLDLLEFPRLDRGIQSPIAKARSLGPAVKPRGFEDGVAA
jgi:hypothetical protein